MIFREWKHRLASRNNVVGNWIAKKRGGGERKKKQRECYALIICFALKDPVKGLTENISEASEREHILAYVLISLWPSSKRIVISRYRWWNWTIGQGFTIFSNFNDTISRKISLTINTILPPPMHIPSLGSSPCGRIKPSRSRWWIAIRSDPRICTTIDGQTMRPREGVGK